MSKWPDRLKLLDIEESRLKSKLRREVKVEAEKLRRRQQLYDRLHSGIHHIVNYCTVCKVQTLQTFYYTLQFIPR